MPPRISRNSVPSGKTGSKVRKPKKAAKRAHDAYSIASHTNPDRLKIRQSRLGESDLASHRNPKRSRDDDDQERSEDEPSEAKRRKQKKVSQDDLSLDEGSDSEGHAWTMGHVDDEDDSEIDSDEAFGESDEERFEGWVFRGSTSTHHKLNKSKPRKLEHHDEDMDGEIDLDENESADGEDDDEDDLGEGAIDLATALDQYEDSEEERGGKRGKKKRSSAFDDSEPSEAEDVGADGASDFSSEEDEEDEADRRAQLKDLISSLPEDEAVPKMRKVDVHESAAPSEFGVLRKVDLTSLKSTISDPERRKSLKFLQDDLKPSKKNDIARKLDAPLPKRQQDKLDRQAANEKANETLGRWVDTVKHNRRAEHISFPLQPSTNEPEGENRLVPTTTAAPANDLESAIQDILQQSGLSNGKQDEEKFQQWEELQERKLPLEEVAKRRAQLRMERELMFREEVRAKRIKKIKSKAYRRVHRKERERILQREKDALRADGVDVSEDEREYNDRRRAEERMGAKHRESKWAKGVKQSGKAAWDEDARFGVTEMARRNEELRRRVEGKSIREDDEGSDFSSEEDEDEDEEMDGNAVLQQQLSRLKQNPFSTDNSKIGNMAFMQKAEASRKAQNDDDLERLRRELAGEETASDDEMENNARSGRRKFGPSEKKLAPAAIPATSEFEERPGSDEENPGRLSGKGFSNGPTKSSKSKGTGDRGPANGSARTDNPYLVKARKSKGDDIPEALWQAQDTIAALQETPKSKVSKSKSSKMDDSSILAGAALSAPDDDGFQMVTYNDEEQEEDVEEDVENEGVDLDIVMRNRKLTAQAFASGGDDEAEFEAEKQANIEEAAPKTETTVLPGWGAWVGEGLTQTEKKNRGKRTSQKIAGIDPSKRKDSKLDKVIINEKRVKKNAKFLATQLPFPFETREQYERSLRVPTGPEWKTKKSFQDATKPRVLIKQGIIKPVERPAM
ncbi:Utp14-domain-containing protein [Polyplosphaeria fusca]|uniref:Utp14-domain-containing protein n=1 Tax=Polyplosphaeria fusca TaxID=682080 RepID=A0A9P4V3V3_9PLEO|nr:Utp14-domain-containing protein [Polyplosphaeria fusca]